MQLILISGVRAKTRSLTLGTIQCIIAFFGLAFVIFMLSALLYYITLSTGFLGSSAFLKDVVISQYLKEAKEKEDLRQQNIDTMASRIGDLQAKLLEIDTITERLSSAIGLPGEIAEEDATETTDRGDASQGGPLTFQTGQISDNDLAAMLDQLLYDLDYRADLLIRIENQLTTDSVRMQLFPGQTPVQKVYMTSGFGYRRDPFTGGRALHTGVDFAAPIGTEILAAASGVVRYAAFHSQYGYMIDLDHGDGLLTRYAHCSRLFVRPGEFVRRGQKIATVGNTGRSTGAHLHFEVQISGDPVNPLPFLRRGS